MSLFLFASGLQSGRLIDYFFLVCLSNLCPVGILLAYDLRIDFIPTPIVASLVIVSGFHMFVV